MNSSTIPYTSITNSSTMPYTNITNSPLIPLTMALEQFTLPQEKEKKPEMLSNKYQFGPITDKSVIMSIRGLAVKNGDGEYVYYDANKDEIVSVDGMTFDNNNLIYAMPVAFTDVCLGDIVIHNKHYCYVMDSDEAILNVLDISDGTVKDIMPTKSPFGFNFVTKVTPLINIGEASAENPFGNVLPFLLMKDGKMDDMLPFFLMNKSESFKDNPYLLYLLCGKDKDNSLLPFLMMQSKK